LLTSTHALDLGRDVAAVPGPIDSPQSVGTNELIRDGAHVITSAADAVRLVGLEVLPKLRPTIDDVAELRVWSALDQVCTADQQGVHGYSRGVLAGVGHRSRAAWDRRVRLDGRDSSPLNDGPLRARTLYFVVLPRHVYVHVPFCARRCTYCDFSIAVRRVVPTDEYATALAGELAVRFGEAGSWTADTLYFGGGTPSRLGR
jgi:hypothetical protein